MADINHIHPTCTSHHLQPVPVAPNYAKLLHKTRNVHICLGRATFRSTQTQHSITRNTMKITPTFNTRGANLSRDKDWFHAYCTKFLTPHKRQKVRCTRITNRATPTGAETTQSKSSDRTRRGCPLHLGYSALIGNKFPALTHARNSLQGTPAILLHRPRHHRPNIANSSSPLPLPQPQTPAS